MFTSTNSITLGERPSPMITIQTISPMFSTITEITPVENDNNDNPTRVNVLFVMSQVVATHNYLNNGSRITAITTHTAGFIGEFNFSRMTQIDGLNAFNRQLWIAWEYLNPMTSSLTISLNPMNISIESQQQNGQASLPEILFQSQNRSNSVISQNHWVDTSNNNLQRQVNAINTISYSTQNNNISDFISPLSSYSFEAQNQQDNTDALTLYDHQDP